MNEDLRAQREIAMSGLTIRDNLCPVELVWEDLVSESELELFERAMPVLRKNWKDAELRFAAHLTEIDKINQIEKQIDRRQERLILEGFEE